MSTHTVREPQPQEILFQMITGTFVTQAIGAAVALGIPDALASGPKSAGEIAAETGAHANSVYRLLRALASVGVFAESDEGKFALAPMSELLRTDRPDSLAAMAAWISDSEHRAAWSNLLHSIRTGEPAFDFTYGAPVFEYLEKNERLGGVFNGAMTSLSRQMHAAAVASYDFAGVGTVVDVGGGHGALIASILAANASTRGVLFDLPHVVAGAGAALESAGVSDRCEVQSESFFESVPGGDLYVLSVVLHDWDDERSVTILRNVREAMNPGGKLLLNEQVVPPGSEPVPSIWLDLEMLVMTQGGRERTEAEWRALLAGAGFRQNRIVPTGSPTSIIEAIPA